MEVPIEILSSLRDSRVIKTVNNSPVSTDSFMSDPVSVISVTLPLIVFLALVCIFSLDTIISSGRIVKLTLPFFLLK